MRFKSCLRCRGDLRLAWDWELRMNVYKCMQCSRVYIALGRGLAGGG